MGLHSENLKCFKKDINAIFNIKDVLVLMQLCGSYNELLSFQKEYNNIAYSIYSISSLHNLAFGLFKSLSIPLPALPNLVLS